MDDEKFTLNVINRLLLVFTIIAFAFMVFMIVVYVNTKKNQVTELPVLETTRGRTSTKLVRTTTVSTTTTTTVTTTKKIASPYYEVDIDKHLNKELFSKKVLSKDEAKELVNAIYEFTNKFLNISDSSVFNIDFTLEHAKANEKDAITLNDNKYGIIYNYKEITDTLFSRSYIQTILKHTYNGIPVLVENNGNYYRLANIMGDVKPIIASVTVSSMQTSSIVATVTYYMSDYKEQGYSAPQYTSTKLELIYESDRWKIFKYTFPSYKK